MNGLMFFSVPILFPIIILPFSALSRTNVSEDVPRGSQMEMGHSLRCCDVTNKTDMLQHWQSGLYPRTWREREKRLTENNKDVTP